MFDLLRREPDVFHFAAGDTIFYDGDAGDCMYGVIEGEVELRKAGHVLEVVGQGGVFGELALIDHHPRSASAVAKTDCKVVAVGEKRFLFLVQQTPYFALQLMQVLADRLRHSTH